MRTTRHTIRILVSSWPAAAIGAFLLKIIIEERFGSAQPRPNFPDLPDPRAHKRGLTGRICAAGTRRFPRRDFAGRSAPALTPSVLTCVHRDCRYPVQLIEDSDDSMANFDSVIDGLDLAADIYDFHPEVPHLHRDWAHPATSAPGLGSPLRSTPRCRRSGPQRGHLQVVLYSRISFGMRARCAA
jgi:hypothetical protein